MRVVKNFSKTVSGVSRVLKKLRKRDGIRHVVAKVSFVVVGANCVGAPSCEHAGPRGTAYGVLAISVLEKGASSSEPINIGGVDVGSSVAIEFGT